MLTLEVDSKSGCGGSCTDCALSRVNMSTNVPESRIEAISTLQSLVIEATLRTFTKIHENIRVGITGCLMNYNSTNIPEFPNKTVEQITLYLETEEYDSQIFFDKLSLFLSAYPNLQTMHISFFRGVKHVAQQVQALRVLMTQMVPFFESSSLQEMELFFWANDIPPSDHSFYAVDSGLSHVFKTSLPLRDFRDGRSFVQSRDAIERHAFVFSDRSLLRNGNTQRVITLGPKRGEEKYLRVGLNCWTAQPKEVTAEDMLQKIGNIQKPGVIHIGWNRVFPFHYPEFTQVPGAHVSNTEYLQMLARFREGVRWSDIISAPILARMA